MKLIPYSALMKEEVWTLFLLTLANLSPTKAGSEFRNCLGDLNYKGIIKYSTLDSSITNYAWTSSCLNGQCAGIPAVYLPMADLTFQCAKVGQSTFCVTSGSSDTGGFGGVCGGILGEVPAVNASVIGVTDCPSLDMVANSLVTGPTTNSTFTWLCCNNRLASCQTPLDVTVTNGWATTNCEHIGDINSLMCFADNGGWSCAGGRAYPAVVDKKIVTSIYLGIGQIIAGHLNNSCTLQLGGVGLSKNVLPVSSKTTIPTLTATITETIVANNEAIPTWGTALVGIGSSLTTILAATVIKFCWMFTHRTPGTPVMFIPGTVK